MAIAGWMNRQQQEVIAYLRTENLILREKQGGKRLNRNVGSLAPIQHRAPDGDGGRRNTGARVMRKDIWPLSGARPATMSEESRVWESMDSKSADWKENELVEESDP